MGNFLAFYHLQLSSLETLDLLLLPNLKSNQFHNPMRSSFLLPNKSHLFQFQLPLLVLRFSLAIVWICVSSSQLASFPSFPDPFIFYKTRIIFSKFNTNQSLQNSNSLILDTKSFIIWMPFLHNPFANTSWNQHTYQPFII